MQIRPINNQNRKRFIKIFSSHPEYYGKYNPKKDCAWLMGCDMFEVENDIGETMAYFGLSFYGRVEVVLNNVYVMSKFRRKHVFTKIVKFAKNMKVQYGMQHLTIACKIKNKVALNIYNEKFNFLGEDKKLKCYWFEIC